jgi:hypothetical protein
MPFVGLTCRPPGIGEGLSSNIDRVPKNVTKGEVPSVVKPAAYLSLKDPVCGMSVTIRSPHMAVHQGTPV